MKTFLSYFSALIIGIVLINFNDIKFFLFYIFSCLLLISYYINQRVDYNRKLIRRLFFDFEIKLFAIKTKMQIDESAYKNSYEKIKSTFSEKEWNDFIKELHFNKDHFKNYEK